jgi:hypothetical protein
MPYYIPSLLNVTAFHCSVFTKDVFLSNQQLALSRLMHNIRCDTAILPYQPLVRKKKMYKIFTIFSRNLLDGPYSLSTASNPELNANLLAHTRHVH